MKKKFFIWYIFLIIYKIIICDPSCKEGVNFCSRCNPVTKLCAKCQRNVYIPDENGGCTYSRKCSFGENYCMECNDEGNLCINCEDDYYPDQNGGCSYTDNCVISEMGKCYECEKDFILIGVNDIFNNEVRICKWRDSEGLQNCEKINTENGSCSSCKEGYFLNSDDKKCIKEDNCYESYFGICQQCKEGYYMIKKEQKCLKQEGIFLNCKESLDGKKCNLCDENYHLSEDERCISINFCSRTTDYGKCKKCIEGYYLTINENACTQDINCFSGDNYFCICYSCKEGYYLDLKDRSCKSNQENNKLKYCEEVDINGNCKRCIYDYKLGEDNKCCNSQYCSESENQVCKKCINNYHLGTDNLCTNITHCIKSNYLTSECKECEDNYYFDKLNSTCNIAEGNFTDCKYSNNEEYCQECKDEFYLNQIDHLCYNNQEKGVFYKCALTTLTGEKCMTCIENYYLGSIDNKCSTIEGCEISENENKCKQCFDYYYCLDLKTGKCEENDIIISEEKKFYFRCNKTNNEGTACKECLFDYSLNKNGLCIDNNLCEEEINGVCQKCIVDNIYYYCLNKDFGCIEMFDGEGCLECNDNSNLDACTKCMEGYELNYKGKCIEIDNKI